MRKSQPIEWTSTGMTPTAWKESSDTSAPTSCALRHTASTSTIYADRKRTCEMATSRVRESIAASSCSVSMLNPSAAAGTTTISAPNRVASEL